MKTIGIAFLLSTVMLSASCNIESDKGAASRTISAKEAYQMMNDAEEFVILDVRTESEYKERHIEGALLIPDYELGIRAEAELPDKSALIFVYCRGGGRSAKATNELIEMGYSWPFETESG
jgi:rhodanese-related sulfurtransferase